MPPKKNQKSAKIDKNEPARRSRSSAQPAQRQLAGASERARARAANLTFLSEALNAAKAEHRTEDYSSSGHFFVAVGPADSKSFGQDSLEDHDPLNLSQKDFGDSPDIHPSVKPSILLPPELASTSKTIPLASFNRSLPATHASSQKLASTSKKLSPASPIRSPPAAHFASSQELPSTSKTLPVASSIRSPPAAHASSQELASTLKKLPPASSLRSPPAAHLASSQELASTSKTLPAPSIRSPPAAHASSQEFTIMPKEFPPASSRRSPPAAHFASSQELPSTSKTLPVASPIRSPPAAHASSQELTSTSKNLPPASSIRPPPAAPAASASSRSSLEQALPIAQPESPPSPSSPASPPQSPLQPMNYSTDDSDLDDGGKDAKYAKLLTKYQKQTELLKASRKKNATHKLQLAEMKDLVVHAVAEAKKARTGENTNTTFQLDPEVNMSVAQIENIIGISKSVASFAQNLALHLYGAENLRERSVKGRSSNRMKNTPDDRPARPGISPKKLEFIYAKAQERVALEVGANNLGQIKTLSHESVINKAIAEKIANLRKAAKSAERRYDNTA